MERQQGGQRINVRGEIEKALRQVAESISGSVGQDFFRSLVRDLAFALRVRVAFISELHPVFNGRVRLIALWEGTRFGENFEYDVKGTPCEQVFEKGFAYYGSQVHEKFPQDRWLVERRIQSYLAIPLYSSRGSPIGHLGVMDDRPMEGDFPREPFLRIFALRAGAEVERRGADLDLREKTKELELTNRHLSALYNITSAAGESLELDVVLQEVIKKITEIFRFDATGIYLFDSGAEELVLASYFAEGGRWPQGTKFQRGRGIITSVATTGEPLIFENLESDDRYEKIAYSKSTRKAGYKFLAVFPINSKQKLGGTIACLNRIPRRLVSHEVQLIMSMAGQIGVAIENIRLYEQTKEQASLLSALYAVAAAAGESLNLDAVLQEVIKKIAEIFQFDGMRVYVAHPVSGDLRLRASFQTCPEMVPSRKFFKRGQGHVGRVTGTGRPLVFDNIQTDPEYQKLSARRKLQKSGFGFLGAFPIRSKNKNVGAFACIGREPRHLSSRERQLITTMGFQIGGAVENIVLFEEVRDGQERLRILSRRLVEVQEMERRHIAQELHDEIGQLLTALNLKLEVSKRLPADQVVAGLSEAQAFAAEVTNRVREMSLNLRPAMLDDLGLLPTLNWQVDRLMGQTGIQVVLEQRGIEGRRFPPDVETAAYRLVQEGLTNVVRHAHAREVTVRIEAESWALKLNIEDEGVGFSHESVAASGKGSGLAGMRERAMAIGGQLMIESQPGKGTKLSVSLPLKASEGDKNG